MTLIDYTIIEDTPHEEYLARHVAKGAGFNPHGFHYFFEREQAVVNGIVDYMDNFMKVPSKHPFIVHVDGLHGKWKDVISNVKNIRPNTGQDVRYLLCTLNEEFLSEAESRGVDFVHKGNGLENHEAYLSLVKKIHPKQIILR